MTMLALQQHQHQDDLTSYDACSLVALASPFSCSRKRTTTQVMLSALPRWEASARSVLAACSESRIGFTMATASCQHSSEARHLEELSRIGGFVSCLPRWSPRPRGHHLQGSGTRGSCPPPPPAQAAIFSQSLSESSPIPISFLLIARGFH